MTGFGRAEVKENGFMVCTEVRSLNHRFLDIEIRLPRNLQACEMDLREIINRNMMRGRVSVAVTVSGSTGAAENLSIDKQLAGTYLRLLEDLRQELKLDNSIELAQLLSLPDIVVFESNGRPDPALLDAVKRCLQGAVDDLKTMRIREGEEICKDIVERINAIDSRISDIQARAQESSAENFAKLQSRIAELTSGSNLDEARLTTEVALLADKADVTEECIRFKSHNTLFVELLEKASSEGRKLNFLLQEMNREANTIGSKANDAQIAHWVVQVKEEVEKLREQIQNIE